jgi:hypothetical protein
MTGEINFKPDMKDEYKEMWLMFQAAFPQAFEHVRPRDEEQPKTEDAYNHAMGVFKDHG